MEYDLSRFSSQIVIGKLILAAMREKPDRPVPAREIMDSIGFKNEKTFRGLVERYYVGVLSYNRGFINLKPECEPEDLEMVITTLGVRSEGAKGGGERGLPQAHFSKGRRLL